MDKGNGSFRNRRGLILCLLTICIVVIAAVFYFKGIEKNAGQEMHETPREESKQESQKVPLEEEEKAVEETEAESELLEEETEVPADVIYGDEQFDEYIPLLEGKRVALFTNQTGIVGDENTGIGDTDDPAGIPFGVNSAGGDINYGKHIIDALVEQNVHLSVIFCPEHGLRGAEDAGAPVYNYVDERTGVPVVSLYGSKSVPSSKDMDMLDILVADMQDVGLRYYTYSTTLYYLMNACAAAGKKVLILDRPNPNGFYVDGPILQDAYKSGVGQLPIPVVYGMTWGELAQMINGEGWLKEGKDACDLTVIPCRNYTHQTKVSLIRRPSPNLRDMKAVYLYASTCFFENTQVSVGRGTEHPFEIYGSPCLEGVEGYSFSFTPKSIPGALNPPFLEMTCWGRDLQEVSVEDICKKGIDLSYLIDAYAAVKKVLPEESFWGTPDNKGIYWIDNLSGSDNLRKMIEEGKTAEEIKESWEEEISLFLEQRRPYLLYDE